MLCCRLSESVLSQAGDVLKAPIKNFLVSSLSSLLSTKTGLASWCHKMGQKVRWMLVQFFHRRLLITKLKYDAVGIHNNVYHMGSLVLITSCLSHTSSGLVLYIFLQMLQFKKPVWCMTMFSVLYLSDTMEFYFAFSWGQLAQTPLKH